MIDLRTHGGRVRKRILDTGLRLWRDDPGNIGVRRIAKELSMSHASILHHFKNSDGLQDALIKYAFSENDHICISYLILMKHPSTNDLSYAEKMIHLRSGAGNRT